MINNQKNISFPKFIVLCNGNDYGNALISKLNAQNLCPYLIIQESYSIGTKKRINQRLKKYGYSATLLWIFRTIYEILISKKDSSSYNLSSKHWKKVTSANSPESIAIIKEIKPNFILNSTSTILKKEIIDSPEKGVFGMHPGILPKFQGLSSVEWQLHDNEVPGYTIFKLTTQVDLGTYYFQKKILPIKGENLARYNVRFFNVALDNLVEIAQNITDNNVLKPMQVDKITEKNRGLINLKAFFLAKLYFSKLITE